MRNYKFKLSGLLTLVFSFILSSCTQDFEEINTNPNGPLTVPAGLYIPGIVEVMADNMYSTFNGGDMGSCWAQHWSKVQYNDEERYVPRATQFDAIWDDFYSRAIKDAETMYSTAVIEKNSNLQGVALTLKAFAYLQLTDLFGDVPYTQALKAEEGVNTPVYDTQASIYEAVLLDLDNANTLLTAGGGTITAASDIMYGGDFLKWKKFANSLKFRALMRISGRSDFNKENQLQEVLSNRQIFTSNADEAKLVFLAAAPNNNPVNASIIGGNRGEYKINSALVTVLSDLNDPRLAVYAQPNADDEYRGKPAGITNVPNQDYGYENVSSIGTLYLEATAPAYFLSYAELELLIAEAIAKGFVTGNTQQHYEAGVRASFESNGLSSSASAYLTADGAFDSFNAEEQIGLQKWIALFGQGYEAFTEWRRVKIPALTPAIQGAINEIPSRFAYPPSEQSLNKTNYDAATQRQGPDLLTTKLWWNQ
jgi:hypothetical protein